MYFLRSEALRRIQKKPYNRITIYKPLSSGPWQLDLSFQLQASATGRQALKGVFSLSLTTSHST